MNYFNKLLVIIFILSGHLSTFANDSCKLKTNNNASQNVKPKKYKFATGIIPKIHDIKSKQHAAFRPLVELTSTIVNQNIDSIPSYISEIKPKIKLSDSNEDLTTAQYTQLTTKDNKAHLRSNNSIHLIDSLELIRPATALIRYKLVRPSVITEIEKVIGESLPKARNYLWVDITKNFETEKDNTILEFIPTPIGSYQLDHYHNLILTTSSILHMLKSNKAKLTPLTVDIDAGDINFGRKEGSLYLADGMISKSNPSYNALVEGIISLHQLLVMLTASKIESVEPEQIIKDLLEKNEHNSTSISKITQMLPMALVGPLAIADRYIDSPLQISKNGRFVPTPHFMAFLKSLKNNLIPLVNSSQAEKHVTCTGCPMVARNEEGVGAIDLLAEMYLNVYENVIKYNFNSESN